MEVSNKMKQRCRSYGICRARVEHKLTGCMGKKCEFSCTPQYVCYEPADIDKLVNRFLAWELPVPVCSDTCVCDAEYQFERSGTNLLDAGQARQMIEYLLGEMSDGMENRTEISNDKTE
jgi:hypothetical protein